MTARNKHQTARNKHQRVKLWVDEGEHVRRMLEEDGPNVVCRLMADGRSLRQIAREACLSATYLSQVRNGHARISPTSYMALLRLEMNSQ